MDVSEAIKKMRKRLSGKESVRTSYEPTWKDLREHVLPDHGRFPGEQSDDGKLRDEKVLDNTPMQSLKILAAGMQSGLTSPARKWFRLTCANADLMSVQSVKEWFYSCEERVYGVLSRIGYYNATHHTYLELGGFGTGAFGIFEGPYTQPLLVRQYTVGEYYLGCDAQGKVDSFMRVFKMTAAQMVEEFGKENCSQSVQTAYNEDRTDGKFDVVQAIEFNDDRIELPNIKQFAFRTIYFEQAGGEADKALKVSGYHEFPVMAPRWHVVGGDVYGFGLARDCFAEIKTLMKLRMDYFESVDMVKRPPTMTTGSVEDLDLLPDGKNQVQNSDAIKPIFQINAPLQALREGIQDARQSVRSGFFADLFLMLANDDKTGRTATEIAERHEEKLVVLGPVLERLHSEMLSPSIERVFSMLMRIGYLPPPPEEMLRYGGNIKIEYISLLDQAQKAVGLTGFNQFTQFMSGLAQLKPSVLDKIDVDEMADAYGDATGMPPTCIVSDEQVAALRQARAKQQQQIQQMQALQAGAATAAQGAQAAKTISDIPESNPTLQALLGPMLQR